MYPSCSEYARDAFDCHGTIEAALKVSDRLQRCGHDLDNYVFSRTSRGFRYIDPVRPADLELAGLWQQGSARMSSVSLSIPAGQSTENTKTTIDSLLHKFAGSLREEGDYERAITEYRRLLSYYPDSRFSRSASIGLLECYYASGRYDLALQSGDEFLSSTTDMLARSEILLVLGKSNFRRGDYTGARNFLYQSRTGRDNTFVDYTTLWEGASYAAESDWTQAREIFGAMSGQSASRDEALYLKRLCDEGEQLPRKKPAVAGVLSIIPGLGYLYSGYPRTALSAFVINSLFIWGAYAAFDNDNPGLGSVLAVVGIGWYSGNIYGSIMSARKTNWMRRHDLFLKFDKALEQ